MDVDLIKNLENIRTSQSYRLAAEDTEFLLRPALRPVRMQLELLKPEMILTEQGVDSTVVVFGGTQIVPADEAQERLVEAEKELAENPDDELAQRNVKRAQSYVRKAKYYQDAYEFGKIVSSTCQSDGKCDYVIVTGGGPGLWRQRIEEPTMWVPNRSVSILPCPMNKIPTRTLPLNSVFNFTICNSQMHFLLRAKALVIFPGGFGTLDELFETLTLRQVGRMQEIPIILYGREYWDGIIDFQKLADESVIRDEHLDLIDYAETPQQAWDIIAKFHAVKP